MKTKILLLMILSIWFLRGNTQSHGRIEGKVFGSEDSLSLMNAQVTAKAGEKVYRVLTDAKGHFMFKGIEPGAYTIEMVYSGFTTHTITDVTVNSNMTTNLYKSYLVFKVMKKDLKEVVISGTIGKYDRPLIDMNGGNIVSMGRKEIEDLPVKDNIPTILTYMSSEFYKSDNSNQMSFRGSRDGETAFYVDDVRVESANGIPSSALRSLTLYSGGVPAKYGDFLGGVVVIETMSYNEWAEERNNKEEYWRYVYKLEQEKLLPQVETPATEE